MLYPIIQPQVPGPFPKNRKSPFSYSFYGKVLASPDDPILPPDKEVPYPEEEEEITPNPDMPEEEEYLPDEEKINDDPFREKEIEDPYQPKREEQFPPKKEPGFPQTDPDF
tara:strand:- start:674 stop:1006 length:333 start_codon:yes stop_codon:yes gene_type:complete